MTNHLSEVTVAGFLDGKLSRADRRAAEAHLAECAECREEIVDVSRLTKTPTRLPLRPLAAAAAIAVVALGVLQWRTSGAPREIMRGATETEVRTISPVPDGAVASNTIFAWHAVGDAANYRLTITTADGDIVSEKMIADTTTTLQLAGGSSYQWYVAAILQNGATRSSAVKSFHTR